MKLPVFSHALSPLLPQCSPRFSAGNPAHRKEHPRFALVDRFDTKRVDIDGDEIPDLSHGEMGRRIIRMLQPDAEVVPFEVKSEINPTPGILKNLKNIASSIRKGEYFDAVAFPWCCSISFQESYSPDWYQEKIRQTLEKIAKKGIPIYIPAGNEGIDFFNLYSSTEWSINVGAMGARFNKTFYSADNSGVNCFAQGTYNIYKVDGGYDLNGDGIPEVLDCEVSGRGKYVNPHVAAFAGKPLDSVLANENDWAELESALKAEEFDRIPERLFSLDELNDRGLLSKSVIQKLKVVGDFTAFSRNADNMLRYRTFRINRDGKVIYSPDGSLNQSATHHMWGTCAAVPAAMVAKWQAKTSLQPSAKTGGMR